jgi:glycine/D-amino acid oxidase-like deaminating enzyme
VIDVVIAGGAAVGSATAHFLTTQPGFTGSVVVVEPDPTYAFAASARSAASIRQQFSTPLNIALSTFGIEFIRRFHRAVANVGLVESTYLYLASSAGEAILRQNVDVQRGCGIATRVSDAAAVAARYPWINAADIAAASDTPEGEGWFDGYALLQVLRRDNERRGVRYIRDRVDSVLMQDGNSVAGVRLGCGDTLACRWLVNATGTRSRDIAAQAGIELPVFPRKRSVFVFTSPAVIEHCPMVIDTSGLWFRPEHDKFICGTVPTDDRAVAPDDFEVDHAQFDELVWPALAHRVPAFEAVRVASAWAGHYDYNAFDQNAFLGPTEAVPNLLLASGFSGHGLQHAPAVGRALSEYITFGKYLSIDVTPFAYSRYLAGRPLREHNII